MLRSKPNDWKQFIDFQTKTVKLQDSEANFLKQRNKEHYRSIIEAQLQYKALQRQRDLQAKEQEALSLYQSLNDYEQFKTSQKTLNSLTKNSIFNEYSKQVSSKQEKLQELYNKDKELEKTIIANNKKAIESAMNLEKLKKNQSISCFQDFLNYKNNETLKKHENEIRAKFQERQLLNESSESFYKNQREYYNTLSKIEEKQQIYQQSYIPVQSSENFKRRSRSELIEKWESEVEKKKTAQEICEFERRTKQKKSEVQILQNQISQKLQQKNLEKLQTTFEKQSSDLGIIQNRIQRNQQKEFLNEFKKDFGKNLEGQMFEKEQERFRENTLSLNEKMVNKEILENSSNGKEMDFKAIPGLHRSQSVRRPSSRLSEITGFENLFKQENPKRTWLNSSFTSEKSINSHNPITNPIGFSLDLNRSFRRGRGLSTLL